MIRTGIPVTVWEAEGDSVIHTALELLSGEAQGIDYTDDSTIPKEWR